MSVDPLPSATAAPHFTPKRSATELFDAAIQLARRHYATFVTVTAIAFVPVLLIAPFAGVLLPEVVVNVLNTVCAGYAEACLLVGVAAAYRGEAPLTVSEQLRAGRSIAGRVIGIVFIRSIATLLGLILLIVPGVLAYAHYYLAAPVAALEDLPGGPAIKRGGALAKGEYGRILAVAVLSLIVFLVLLFGVAIVVGLVSTNEALQSLVALVLQIVTLPGLVALSVLVYFDIRDRREGLDIERALGVEGPAPHQA
jgi:uncharacterized membrane protein